MKPKLKDEYSGFWKDGVIVRAKDLIPIVEKINELQDEIQKLKDENDES